MPWNKEIVSVVSAILSQVAQLPQTRTQSLFMCFGGERRLGVRLRRARGFMENSDWQITFAGDVQMLIETCRSLFFKVKALFWYFLLSILCDVYFFIINNKKVSKKYFYAFSGVLVVSPAWLAPGKPGIPGNAWTISMVLFIVYCVLKVGNSFLHIFSRFLSFTEILDTFDFSCLCFFVLLSGAPNENIVQNYLKHSIVKVF